MKTQLDLCKKLSKLFPDDHVCVKQDIVYYVGTAIRTNYSYYVGSGKLLDTYWSKDYLTVKAMLEDAKKEIEKYEQSKS